MSPYSKRTHKILGIDPGNNLGVSTIEVDGDFNVIGIDPVTYFVEKHIPKSTYKETRKAIGLEFIYDTVLASVKDIEPLIIARENAFVNARFPGSGLSLSRIIGVMEVAFRKAGTTQPILRLAPKEIKSGIGAGGRADKDDMVAALLKIDDLREHVSAKIDLLDEHNVDALAMAYVALKAVRNNPSLLLAMAE